MKIIDALPKYLGLVICFDSQTQLGMQSAQALLQKLRNVVGPGLSITVAAQRRWLRRHLFWNSG